MSPRRALVLQIGNFARIGRRGRGAFLPFLLAIRGPAASCSSDEPSEARQLACKIAYQQELEHADEKFMKDSADFRRRAKHEDMPVQLAIRIQESFNNSLEFVKARASRKLENCLVTGYYERSAQ